MPTLVQRPPTTTANASRRSAQRRLKILLAALAALLLHAVLIVLLAWALPHWPRPPLRKGSAPITLTIQSAEPSPTPEVSKTEVVPSQQHPEYTRTNDDQHSDTPPPDPAFISSQHTLAASENPAEDPFKPLPSQTGRDIAAFDFKTQPYMRGPEAHDNNSAAGGAAAQPLPTPPETPPPATPTPKPIVKATPTPRPASSKPTPTPGEFAELKPSDSPSETPPEPSRPPVQDLLARQAARVARENGSVASTAPKQPPGFQPQTEQTKMSGSVNNHGKSSVSALGTPLGRYQKAVEDAISARWYFNVEENMSNLVRTGEVKVHFVVTRAGKITNTRVSGSNQNTTLADISLEAVVNAEVPPIPAEVASMLPEGQLEGDLTFIMY